MSEKPATVTISRADKKFLAAALFLQTSILCLAISISGAWYSNFVNESVEHKLKIKSTLNRLERDIALKKQRDRYEGSRYFNRGYKLKNNTKQGGKQ